MNKSITQDMAYRQSLMRYAEKYGVRRASLKYNKSRSYIYFWKARWDGTVESLACQSRRPHSHPNQHTQAELKLIRDMRRRNPELGMVELWHRLRFLAAYPEQSTFSSADFLKRLVKWYARWGIRVECVQTDNGFEFTNRFSNSRRDLPTLFEATADKLGIRHKLIRPYTPRHNGKVERSHREDQKRFYSCHSFFSLDDFDRQLDAHNRRSNNFPMRPLAWLSPIEFAVQFV